MLELRPPSERGLACEIPSGHGCDFKKPGHSVGSRLGPNFAIRCSLLRPTCPQAVPVRRVDQHRGFGRRPSRPSGNLWNGRFCQRLRRKNPAGLLPVSIPSSSTDYHLWKDSIKECNGLWKTCAQHRYPHGRKRNTLKDTRL
jgi:hypothetical protein